jgi:HSP20 family protein
LIDGEVPMWDPFGDLAAFRREMVRVLETFAGVVKESDGHEDVEVTQTEDGWTVIARLPGVAPEEVSVEVDKRDLRIRAKSEPAAKGEPAGDARHLSLDFHVRLSGEVDPDRVDATMDHGLLTVRLPRSGPTSRRTIPVQRPQ